MCTSGSSLDKKENENENLANIMHVTFSCKEDLKITKMQKSKYNLNNFSRYVFSICISKMKKIYSKL